MEKGKPLKMAFSNTKIYENPKEAVQTILEENQQINDLKDHFDTLKTSFLETVSTDFNPSDLEKNLHINDLKEQLGSIKTNLLKNINVFNPFQ